MGEVRFQVGSSRSLFFHEAVLTDTAPGASDCYPSVLKAQGDAAPDTAPKSG